MPTLLFINGPTGIGKTTLAQKYVEEHPFALLVSGDDIIAGIGQWLTHEAKARSLTFELIKSMASTHLRAGYDVVIPHLLANPAEAVALEDIAQKYGATFFECVLLTDKEEAIARALERGTWGEPGSPPMTDADTPILEELFDSVHTALAERPNATRITSVKDDIDGTYREILAHLK